MEEALQQRTYRDAVAGKRMSPARGFEMDHEARGLADEACAESVLAGDHAVTSRPIPTTRMLLLLLLGIAALNPARADIGANRAQLLLEPWAVQAALRRRRGGNRLTDRERDEIRRCTRDPDCLRWPRGTDE